MYNVINIYIYMYNVINIYIYIYIYNLESNNFFTKNVTNTNCLYIKNPLLLNEKDSQGVVKYIQLN